MKNRTILITGGGSGIGEAIATHLSKDNKVIICGRKEEKLRRVANTQKNIHYYVTDVSKAEEIEALFSSLVVDHHTLDVLINNAGTVEQWNIADDTLETADIFAKINTNLSGAIAVTQKFIHQSDRKKENLIINVSSTVALFPIPILPLYSASKAGLHVFSKALRAQLKNSAFKVIEILPPAVDTDMPKQLGNKGKLLNVDDFALAMIEAVNKGKNEFTKGSDAFLLKMFNRFLPNKGLALIDKMSRKQLQLN